MVKIAKIAKMAKWPRLEVLTAATLAFNYVEEQAKSHLQHCLLKSLLATFNFAVHSARDAIDNG